MELFRLVVENRKGKRIVIDCNDPRCQYIYCPLEELKYIVTDTRQCIGDYTVLKAINMHSGRFISNEELFGEYKD